MLSAIVVGVIAVGVDAATAETFDEPPVVTEPESPPFESRCSAAGGVLESRPRPERNGTITECVRTYTVRRGDWLWKVARATLRARGVRPTSATVKTEAARIYEANESTIGPNPNRLFVGQKLRVLAIDGGLATFQGPTLRS